MATRVKPRELSAPQFSEEVTGCSQCPQPQLVLLPELCLVHYPNGTMVESVSYISSYCSNCLCSAEHSGICSEDRCCCSANEMTNLTYTCPNYFNGETVMISDIPLSCVCQSCSRLQVSFVVQVLDVDKVPVSLANVTVDGQNSYQSDEQGFVGFTISAAQVKVNISVQAFLFKDFQRHYFVVPGSVNKLTITLQVVRAATLVPPQNPFIIRFSTLEMVVLRRSISFTAFTLDDLIDLIDLMDTFDLYYGEVFAYFPPNVFPENALFTFVSPSPQSLYNTATHDSLDVSFLVHQPSRLTRLSYDAPLMSIGWGQLEIYDEDGRPFDPISLTGNQHYSVLVGLSPFLRLSRGKLEEAQLFAYNDSSESFKLVKKSSYIYQSYSSKIQWAIFPIFSSLQKFPLRLAVAYEEENICYVPARVRDSFSLTRDNSTSDTTIIRVSVRSGLNASSVTEQAVFLNSGAVNSCIAIPCHGELSLKVLGNSKYQTSTIKSIGDYFDEYENERIGPIYKNLRACEAFGLESDIQSSDSEHLLVDLVPNYCPKRENIEHVDKRSFTPQMATQALHENTANDVEFCSIKVLVNMCSQTITTATFITGEGMLVKSMSSEVETNQYGKQQGEEEEESYDEMEYQSGDDMQYASDCSRVSELCFSFLCNSRVNMSVVNSVASSLDSSDILQLYNDELLLTGMNNSEIIQYSTFPCLPHSNSHSPDLYFSAERDQSVFLSNTAPQDSAEFVFEGTLGGERGVFRSLNMREVAQQKCMESDLDNVGVYFDCVAKE